MRKRKFLPMSIVLAMFCASLASESAGAADSGIWEKRVYSFAFMGFTSTYSCDGLADKIRVLLLAAGARPDAKSRSGACASGFGKPDRFARAELTFYALVPSPAGLGSDTPAASTVNGMWRPVQIAERSPRELARGDCELVEQFNQNVLSLLTTRNVENRTVCVPNQNSGSIIDLKFETFATVAGQHHK